MTRKIDKTPAEAQRQPVPLIRTKLHRPPVTSDILARGRLLELMERALEVPLTVVAAPAGYGKSVLVSQWAEQFENPVAWLSLDKTDSDLREFLTYVLAAIDAVSPGACPLTQESLKAPELPPLPVVAGHLINEFDAIDTPCLIVLDDYHRIDGSSPVHELIGRWLEHPPRHVHLVLATRRDPPLPLAGLRADNRVVDVRLQDLRFADTETAALLAMTTNAVCSEGALANLQHEVEGWAVGLRLVLLALCRADKPDSFLRELRGGLQHTQEYLLQEVLAGLTPEFRECLLQASVLDRFCPELLDKIRAPEAASSLRELGGREIVDQLRNGNLFVIGLDTRGEWFRYHPLFQDFLQRQLRRRYAQSDIEAIHSRASAWFESHGLITESIRHALATGDAEGAADIIERHRYDEMNADRWYVIQEWMAKLPADITQRRPGLLLMQGWLAYWRFELPRLVPLVEQIGPQLDEETTETTLLGELDFFRGNLAYWQGDFEDATERLEQALSRLAGAGGIIEGNVEIILALARCMGDKRKLAVQTLNARIRSVDPAELTLHSQLIGALIFVHLLAGELAAAGARAEQLQAVATKAGMSNTVAWAPYFSGCAYLHSLDLDRAADDFAAALRSPYVLEPRAVVDSFAGVALAQQLAGEAHSAEQTVGRLMSFAREANVSEYQGVADSCRARLAVLRGDVTPVAPWAWSFQEVLEPSTLFVWLEIPSITQARVLIAEGSVQGLSKASELLRTICERCTAWRFDSQTIEAVVLQSLALEKQGLADEALDTLDAAVGLAVPGGFVRPFVEAGPVMAEILQRVQTKPETDAFVQRVLAAFEGGGAPASIPTAPGPSVTPPSAIDRIDPDALTNRELDILELLWQRLQNKEIADRLCISTHTVNDHLKNVYQKLGARNRRQAVERAIERGILEPR